ncbi:MAG: glycerate kinase, partial [Bacillales bacterium]|nr:glycerate kinase [Bacillales bacterium]
GSGAGGGIAAGSVFFLKAEMIKGTDYIFSINGIEDKIKKADLIITGEGKTDIQSKEGKVVYSLYEKSLGKPFIAFTGVNEIKDSPFKIVEVNKKGESLKKSIRNTKKNLEEAIYNYFLSIK